VGTAANEVAEVRIGSDGYVQVYSASNVSMAQSYTILNTIRFLAA